MSVDWQQLYAQRAAGMRASDIREILKVTAQPEVISLAGGLPAPAVVPMDEDGMCVDQLEPLLAHQHTSGRRIKFIYAIPNFQNPTGRSMSLERRQRLVELATQFGVPIVEDDPYGELRYEGQHLPT